MVDAVVLGNLELDLVTGLVIDESRKLALHRWPGADGDLVQDMGMAAGRIWLTGVAIGPQAGARLEQLRAAMHAGEPVDFAASAAVASDIEQVLIAGLRVTQPPGRLHYFEYQMELIRYVSPPPALVGGFDPAALAAVAADIESAAKNAVDEVASTVGDAAAMVDKALSVVQGLGALEKVLTAAGNVAKAHAERTKR